MLKGTSLLERYLRPDQVSAAKQALTAAGIDEQDRDAVWRFLETYKS